jgi:hypothetical protein
MPPDFYKSYGFLHCWRPFEPAAAPACIYGYFEITMHEAAGVNAKKKRKHQRRKK